MATRSRKNSLAYKNYSEKIKKNDSCHFCEFKHTDDHIVSDHKMFWVVRNIFPYDLWDRCGVLDHLMIVPKRHTDTLSHLSAKEQIEYIGIITEYESRGYSIYSRAPGNVQKSVFHLHTHLIKLDNQPKKIIIFSKRPNVLVSK